jgi:hypothetical protein
MSLTWVSFSLTPRPASAGFALALAFVCIGFTVRP